MSKSRTNDYLSYLDNPETTNQILLNLASSQVIERQDGQYFLGKEENDGFERFVRDISRDSEHFKFNSKTIAPKNYIDTDALFNFILLTYNLTSLETEEITRNLIEGWQQTLQAGYLISALQSAPFDYAGEMANLETNRLSNLTISAEGDIKIETIITLSVQAHIVQADGYTPKKIVATIPGYICATTEYKKVGPSFQSGAAIFSNSILENLYQHSLVNLCSGQPDEDKINALIQAAELEEHNAAANNQALIQKNMANEPFASAMAVIAALDTHEEKSRIINLIMGSIRYPLNDIYLLRLDKLIDKNTEDKVLVGSLHAFKASISAVTQPYRDAYKQLKTEINHCDPAVAALSKDVLIACDKLASNPSNHFSLPFLTKTLGITKNLLLDPNTQIKPYKKHIEQMRRKGKATQLLGAMKCLAAGLFLAASIVVSVGSLGTFAGAASVGLAIAGGLLASGIKDIREGRKELKEIDQLAKPVGKFIKAAKGENHTVTKSGIFSQSAKSALSSNNLKPDWLFDKHADSGSDSTQATTTEDETAPPRNKRN